MISVVGFRNIKENNVNLDNPRNVIIIAVEMVCGLGLTDVIFQFIIFLDDLQGGNQVFLMFLKTSMSPYYVGGHDGPIMRITD
mgnify:CR=1 FL=1